MVIIFVFTLKLFENWSICRRRERSEFFMWDLGFDFYVTVGQDKAKKNLHAVT
jgi:hypothetical protein